MSMTTFYKISKHAINHLTELIKMKKLCKIYILCRWWNKDKFKKYIWVWIFHFLDQKVITRRNKWRSHTLGTIMTLRWFTWNKNTGRRIVYESSINPFNFGVHTSSCKITHRQIYAEQGFVYIHSFSTSLTIEVHDLRLKDGIQY